jgi:hypothetical protein
VSAPRCTFSVSGGFWRRLCSEADGRGVKPATLVELACADLSTVNAVAVRRASMRARAEGRCSEVAIDVDEVMAENFERIAHVRSAYRGRTVTASDVLDRAINDMLDASSRTPIR